METKARRVVLVTGASGFLGQHIVKELQNENIDEIRAFDCRPYEQKLGMQHYWIITSWVLHIIYPNTDCPFSNHNLQLSKAPLESQVQGISIFTSAATSQRGCPR